MERDRPADASRRTWVGPGRFVKSGAMVSGMKVDGSNGDVIGADEAAPFRAPIDAGLGGMAKVN